MEPAIADLIFQYDTEAIFKCGSVPAGWSTYIFNINKLIIDCQLKKQKNNFNSYL